MKKKISSQVRYEINVIKNILNVKKNKSNCKMVSGWKNEKESINNFVLIIPVYNDQQFIKNSINYYKDSKIKIIYCDSSKEKYLGSFPNNMRYIYLKNYQFPQKIRHVLNKIKTNYVALCPVDDFMVTPSLKKGINFIKNHKDYKMVLGNFLGFKTTNNITFYDEYYYNSFDYNSSVKENAKNLFSKYFMTIWGIYDKETLLKAYEIIQKSEPRNHNFYEFIIGAIFCASGGVKKMEDLLILRRNSIDSWGSMHTSLIDINKSEKIKTDFKRIRLHLDAATYAGYSQMALNTYINGVNKKYKNISQTINLIERISPRIGLSIRKYYFKLHDLYRKDYNFRKT
jgi:glycosyltransferase domain-containing protein